MKVLILGNSLGLGGAQTAFRKFAEFLRHDEIEVAILVICDRESTLPSELQGAILYKLPHSATRSYQRLSKAIHTGRAAWLARRFAPDVFVSVGLARTANWIARSLRPSCFKIAQDFVSGRSVDDPLLNATANIFEAIGVQTPSMAAALLDAGFSARPVNWLPCLPDHPVDGYGKRTQIWAGYVRLAYFGRLAANKGLDLILEAISGVDFAVPVKLDVWGTGVEAQTLSDRCHDLGLSQQVRFLGRYPSGPDGARLMCDYD